MRENDLLASTFIILLCLLFVWLILFLGEIKLSDKLNLIGKNVDEINTEISQIKFNTSLCYLGILKVTSYTKVEKHHNITANGNPAREGIIAISPDMKQALRFGDEVFIEDIGIFKVDDLMHERKTRQVDIFIANKAESKNFGIKYLPVHRVKSKFHLN